jgi:hypothetical protein
VATAAADCLSKGRPLGTPLGGFLLKPQEIFTRSGVFLDGNPLVRVSETPPEPPYARRAYRRSGRQTLWALPPATYGGNLVYTPGSGPPPNDVARSGYGNTPFEWHAAPGPNRRGNMCITHTDPLRGYGYQAACPPAKK